MMFKQNLSLFFILYRYVLIAVVSMGTLPALAQGVGINEDNSAADNSAILDVKSTTKGMLIPRMTTAQRTAIALPATGLLVYDNTTSSFWFYSGTAWTELLAGSPDQIADADNDTKVQTEKNADEDMVRISVADTEHWTLKAGGRMGISNTGKSVFIGNNAGTVDDLTDNENVFIGEGAGAANTQGYQNIALGSSALTAITIGDNNIGIGTNALASVTSNFYNIAIGSDALRYTTRSLNLGIGYRALTNNTEGTRNMAVGYTALGLNTTGVDNMALGYLALYTNTTGSQNLAIGRSALFANTAGDNIALGYRTMAANTTGTRNVALGNFALDVNTTANDNTAIGYDALTSISTGGTNTAIGAYAGSGNSTGIGNVFIGYNAGSTETGSDKLYIDNSNTTSPLVYGDFSSNRLAINGNSTTKATLNVFGTSTATNTYRYLNFAGTATCSNCSGTYSIYAEDKILATEFHATSDARIKHVLGVSSSRRDLNTLMNLRITDYRMKDSISKGNQLYKKLIAQQVKEVYPQAVSLMTDVVPDIYKIADIRQGWIKLAADVKKGDKVKLIFADRVEMKEVLEANAEGFKVDVADEGKVFVFGREVNDFHSVDYEAISMLNVSATQELYKIIEQLQQQNQQLQSQNQQLQSKVDEVMSVKTEVEELKTLLRQQGVLPAGTAKK